MRAAAARRGGGSGASLVSAMLRSESGFLRAVRPALATRDCRCVARVVKSCVAPADLCRFLRTGATDTRRVAAYAAGFVGNRRVVPELVEALADQDGQVREMAECSIWAVWFRAGRPRAVPVLRKGVHRLEQDRPGDALFWLERARDLDPAFVEPLHQRATVHFLQGRYDEALADFRAVTEEEPLHFAAFAGIGHCHAHRGELAAARRDYQRALRIHPHLRGAADALRRLAEA